MNVSDRIKQLTNDKGVTMYVVSQETGISQSTLSRFVTGKGNISRRNLKILSDYFQVGLEWLLTGEGEPYLDSTTERAKLAARTRIIQHVTSKGVSIKDFAKSIKSSAEYWNNSDNDYTIPIHAINKALKYLPELNPVWVFTGEGSMIKEETQSAPTVNEAHVDYRFVPLLNLDAVGGMHRSNEEAATAEYPEKLIPFIDAKEGDICLTVSGDSMAPTCPSGSLVLVRKVERWQEYFGFGNLFVLLLADGRRILKEVQKYEGDPQNFVLCKSHNEKYPAEELPKKLISAVWKVVKMQSDRGW